MPRENTQQRGDRLVIGITGRIGAGKTSVGRYLAEQHGFYYTRYSQVLSDWRAQDPESKAHLQAVGWEVMEGGMQAELNQRLISRIQPQQNFAVDGLRHPTDYECLSSAFSLKFHLLYIESSEQSRWGRLRGRYPKLDLFQAADSHPVEQYIESLRKAAFATVDNEGSLPELYEKVDTVLGNIRPGGQL